MNRTYRIAFGFLVFAFIFVSAPLFAAATVPSKNTVKKAWTFLVFLNADNNLEDAGYDDIREMEHVGSTEDVNVVVQFDGIQPEGTKRLLIEKQPDQGIAKGTKSIRSPILEEMSEQDMGSAQVFADFVDWGMKTFPAENYFVILWNHGSGWSKQRAMVEKGISYDDTSGNHIRTNQLADAIDQIVARTGNRITVLGFDACLMAMFEVADSVVGMVDYMVASEQTEPGDGYDYTALLQSFTARSQKTARLLTQDVVTSYGASYSGGSQGTSDVTQSAFDLSRLELVKRRLDTWLSMLELKSGLKSSDFLEAANNATSYADPNYRDLGVYVRNILQKLSVLEIDGKRRGGENAGLVYASTALLKAIQDLVTANFASGDMEGSTGVSIYLPYGYGGYSSWNSTYSSRKESYMQLKWAKTTAWAKHLDFLFPPKKTP